MRDGWCCSYFATSSRNCYANQQLRRQILLKDCSYCNAISETLWEYFSADSKWFLSFRSRGQASKPQSQRTATDKNRIWGRDHPCALYYHDPDVGWRVARWKATHHVLQWQDSEVRFWMLLLFIAEQEQRVTWFLLWTCRLLIALFHWLDVVWGRL